VTQVNVQEAKTQLSDLLQRSERGEEIIIARAGRPIARLVALDQAPPRRFGVMNLVVPDDFDAPLDESELSAWE
jgi:prevent-host-death family protein